MPGRILRRSPARSSASRRFLPAQRALQTVLPSATQPFFLFEFSTPVEAGYARPAAFRQTLACGKVAGRIYAAPTARYLYYTIFSGKITLNKRKARRDTGVPFRLLQSAYSAVMYLSTMACRVPSACSSSRAPLMASSSWVLPLATPMA